MRRRRVLAVVASCVTVAGCGRQEPADEAATSRPESVVPTNTVSRTALATGSESETNTSAVSTTDRAVTVDVETPGGDSCSSTRPEPTVTRTASDFEAKSYPSLPETRSPGTVSGFAAAFEHAWRYNEFVDGIDVSRVGELDVSVSATVVYPVERADGTAASTTTDSDRYVTGVEGELRTTPGNPEQTDVTPYPYSHDRFGAWYYVTDRFAIRNGFWGELPDNEAPSIVGGTVVRCRDGTTD